MKSPAIGFRWFICFLLFLATAVNYIDRQILALLKETLDRELRWSNENFGLVNSAFQAAYAIGLLFFGRWIDRIGEKAGYAYSIAAWSVAAALHAAVGSAAGFAVARAALGFAEGGNFPSALKATAHWFPKRERALATALFNAGTNVGAIIAPLTVPAIAAAFGWRAAFVAGGLLGFLWLFVWRPFYSRPESSPYTGAAERAWIADGHEPVPNPAPGITWRDALRRRETWGFIVAKFMTDPVWWFFLIWLPDYFKATRGLDIKHSRVHLVSIYAIVTVLSIAGGWLTGRLQTLGFSVTRARKTGMILFALMALPIRWVTSASDLGAVLLIGLAGAAHQAWSANLFTTPSDTFAKKDVATIVGLGGMAGSIGGIIFPWFSGRLLDRFAAHGAKADGYAILFSICATAYVAAFAVHHLLCPRLERRDSD